MEMWFPCWGGCEIYRVLETERRVRNIIEMYYREFSLEKLKVDNICWEEGLDVYMHRVRVIMRLGLRRSYSTINVSEIVEECARGINVEGFEPWRCFAPCTDDPSSIDGCVEYEYDEYDMEFYCRVCYRELYRRECRELWNCVVERMGEIGREKCRPPPIREKRVIKRMGPVSYARLEPVSIFRGNAEPEEYAKRRADVFRSLRGDDYYCGYGVLVTAYLDPSVHDDEKMLREALEIVMRNVNDMVGVEHGEEG